MRTDSLVAVVRASGVPTGGGREPSSSFSVSFHVLCTFSTREETARPTPDDRSSRLTCRCCAGECRGRIETVRPASSRTDAADPQIPGCQNPIPAPHPWLVCRFGNGPTPGSSTSADRLETGYFADQGSRATQRQNLNPGSKRWGQGPIRPTGTGPCESLRVRCAESQARRGKRAARTCTVPPRCLAPFPLGRVPLSATHEASRPPTRFLLSQRGETAMPSRTVPKPAGSRTVCAPQESKTRKQKENEQAERWP